MSLAGNGTPSTPLVDDAGKDQGDGQPEFPASSKYEVAAMPAIEPPSPLAPARPSILASAIADDARRKRVFITHGKSRELVEPIKKLLDYGELIPVVSVERQSVSKPVPEKVMDDMRACGAAIIHVDADKTIIDKAAEQSSRPLRGAVSS